MLRRLLWKNCLEAWKLDRFIERFLAFCSGGLRAVENLVPEILAFRSAPKTKKVRRLHVEQLEGRDLLTVTINGGSDFGSLSAAVGAASPGDTILITTVDMPVGGYVDSAAISLSTLTIEGTPDGFGNRPVLRVPLDTSGTNGSVIYLYGTTDVTISGVSIRGTGDSADGFVAGIWVGSGATLHISDSDVTEIVSSPSNPYISPVLGTDGLSIVVVAGGSAEIDDVSLVTNQDIGLLVTGSGASADISDSTVIGGRAGIMYFDGATGTVDSVSISGYSLYGVYVGGDGTSADVVDSTITGTLSSTDVRFGIYVEDSAVATLSGNTVSSNAFNGTGSGSDWFTNTKAYGIFLFDSGVGTVVENNTITGNDVGLFHRSVNADSSPNATLIEGNTFTDNIRYAIALGRGFADITGNVISGGDYGLGVFSSGDATLDSVGALTGNVIRDASIAGIILDDRADNADTVLTAHFNRIIDNAVGVSNRSTTSVDAENNWWGRNEGPGVTVNGIGGAVDVGPWLVLKATPSAYTIGLSGSTNIVADLTHNSDDEDLSTDPDLGALDGLSVGFSTTLGSLDHATDGLTDGEAVAALTGTGMGTNATISVTLDHESVDVGVMIGHRPVAVDDPIGTLAAWWSFDEGTGSSASDQMAGLLAMLPNNVGWSVDIADAFLSGTSLEFSGADGSVEASGFDFQTRDLTLAFWVNWTTISDTLLVGQDDGQGNLWKFVRDGGNLKFIVGNADGLTTVLDFAWTPPEEDEWYHLAVTREGNDWTLYIDGSEEDSNAEAVDFPDVSGSIMQFGSSGFAGKLDDLLLFRSALSAGDIADIEAGTYAPPSPLSTDEETPYTFAASTLLTNDTDADSDGLTIFDSSQPSHGELRFNLATSEFTYTPEDDYSGPDSFTYIINDGFGNVSTAYVYLTVVNVNDLPVVQNDAWATDADVTVDIDVLANDTDADGETLTIVNTVGALSTGYTGYKAPDHGAVSVVDGKIRYNPDNAYAFGPDSFTYQVTDGHVFAYATVSVFVSNGQWATSVVEASSQWDISPYDWLAFQALGTPNTLSYGDIGTAWAALGENPDDEPDDAPTAVLTLGFATEDISVGALIRETYGNGFVRRIDVLEYGYDVLHPTEFAWHDSIWESSDTTPTGAPEQFIATWSATNLVSQIRIHVALGQDDEAWEEIDAVKLLGSEVTVPGTAPVGDDDEFDVAEDAAEPYVFDIQTAITYSGPPLVLTITRQPTHGFVEIDFNGTLDDPSNDRIRYTPDPDYFGEDSFEYTVTDIYQQSDSGTISIDVTPVNDAPVVLRDIYVNAYKNPSLTIENVASTYAEDIDDETLSVSVGTNAYASESGGSILYLRSDDYTGQDQFDFTVTDPDIESSSGHVYITIFDEGEWADSVDEFDSQYGEDEEADWGVNQMLGAPDTFEYGDSPTAWAAEEMNAGTQVLIFGFPSNLEATGVLVREVSGNGFLTKIEIQDTQQLVENGWHTVWEGTELDPDPALDTPFKRTDVILRFEALLDAEDNPYLIQRVRLTINTNGDDWEEIDAVRLLDGFYEGATTIIADAFNTPPDAQDDFAAASSTVPLVIHVLDNDSDPSDDTLSILDTISAPSHGTAVRSGVGNTTITYTLTDPAPTEGTLQDSFTYEIDDGCGGTATATVYVTIYPDGQWATSVIGWSSQNDSGDYSGLAMQALGTPNTFVYGDTSTAWTTQYADHGPQWITVAFSDPDEATGLLIREISGNGFVSSVQVFYDDANMVYDAEFTGGGVDFDDNTSADGPGDLYIFFDGETGANDIKAVRILIQTDEDGGAFSGIDAVRLLTVTDFDPTNAEPTPAPYDDPDLETDENMPLIIRAGADATDDEGTILLQIDDYPDHGTVEINLNATPNDTSDDYFVYTPDLNFSGTDHFVYRVIDIHGASATADVDILVNPVNQAPIVSSNAAFYTIVDTPKNIPVLDNYGDVEEDDLDISDVPAHSVNGGDLTQDGNEVTYDPDDGFTGPDFFTFTISDENDASITGQADVFVYEPGVWAQTVTHFSSGEGSIGELSGAPDDVAWISEGTAQYDFIEATFTQTAATGIVIRVPAAGYIQSVELLDDQDNWYRIWTDDDPTSGNEFVLNFPNDYDVVGARITLLSGGSIDAMRLITGGTATELTLSSRGYDGSGNFVDTTYDADGHAVLIKTWFQGVVVSEVEQTYTGDYVSEVITTNANGDKVRYTYDEDGNQLTETVAYDTADAAETIYDYDTENRLISLTDPKTNVTTWDYSVPNQVTMTDPLGKDEVKVFNDDGSLASVLNRNGQLTTFAYNTGGQLVS